MDACVWVHVCGCMCMGACVWVHNVHQLHSCCTCFIQYLFFVAYHMLCKKNWDLWILDLLNPFSSPGKNPTYSLHFGVKFYLAQPRIMDQYARLVYCIGEFVLGNKGLRRRRSPRSCNYMHVHVHVRFRPATVDGMFYEIGCTCTWITVSDNIVHYCMGFPLL